ncbi:hypothetical protein ABMA77_12395 [Halobacteriovorax sp. RZ-1]|uniref:hypothetical protein n=1 Tax=unclassified Halobacteriovorax TaxID=2639665 RepID=UPI0037171D0A
MKFASALILLTSLNTFALSGEVRNIKAVNQFDDNAKRSLVIEGSYANAKVSLGVSNFGVRDNESLSIRVIDITGVDGSIPDDFYVRVAVDAYSAEHIGNESIVYMLPDFITERGEVSEELVTGDEITLEGRELNNIEIDKGYGNRVIRLELGKERFTKDSVFGTYALNPAQLEMVERGETLRLTLEDTRKLKRTLTTATIEISKK